MRFPLAATFALATSSLSGVAASSGLSKQTGLSAPLATPSNIFLTDNRKELPTRRPWSAIGYVSNTKRACSGALVGPDLVLTNAHCVVDKTGKELRENLAFFINFRYDPTTKHRSYVAMSKVKAFRAGTRSHINFENDWAILRLEKPLGNTYGYFDVARPNNDALLSYPKHSIYMASYSSDTAMTKPMYQTCGFRHYDYQYNVVLHDCSGITGASGSPMFTFEGPGETKPRIVAVHAYCLGQKSGCSINIPYSTPYGNGAVPSYRFYDTLMEMRKTR